MSKSIPDEVAREPKYQRAASAPISASSSSRLMNSPERLLIESTSPPRMKRTQAIRITCTASRSWPIACAAFFSLATVPWWSWPHR